MRVTIQRITLLIIINYFVATAGAAGSRKSSNIGYDYSMTKVPAAEKSVNKKVSGYVNDMDYINSYKYRFYDLFFC